jgi:tartrate-resistant acid phosphatase type 5
LTRRALVTRRRVLQSGAALTLGVLAPGGLAAAQPPGAQPPSGKADPTFLAIGDWGRGNETQQQVAAAMARVAQEEPLGFVVSTGDNFYRLGVTSTHDPLWKRFFEDVYSAPSLMVPWYPVLGNHDHKGNAMAQVAYSQASARWSMNGAYYWRAVQLQDASQADLFFLATTPIIDKYSGLAWYLPGNTDEQVVWLEQALATSRARWKIVVGHHPVFSGGKHGSTAVLVKLLTPLFKRYGVNVYLNGHDHDLQHVLVDGVHYLTSGAAASPRPAGGTSGTLFASSEPGFLRARLSPTDMQIEFIGANGGEPLYSASLALSA